MERIKYVCIEKKNVIFATNCCDFLLFDNRIGDNFSEGIMEDRYDKK